MDGEGSLYVVDTGNTRVQVFDVDGEVTSSFGTQGLGLGQFIRPKGISVDRFGIIYVVDSAFNNVQMFDAEFRLLMPLGKSGKEPGRFWLPTCVHVDDGDFIYVADYMNGRIQVLRFLSETLEGEESFQSAE